jgi:hypothetical protein
LGSLIGWESVTDLSTAAWLALPALAAESRATLANGGLTESDVSIGPSMEQLANASNPADESKAAKGRRNLEKAKCKGFINELNK